MPTDFRLHIDPADVMGVSRDATMEEIRDAYRAKAKRHHPDAGGEAWVFHILNQAYELMSTARVALHASGATPPTPPPRRPQPPPPRPEPTASFFTADPPPAQARRSHDSHETVRPGVQEPAIDPAQVVDVEKVTIRYEADHVWLITDRARKDRLLSSCLNVTWPGPELHLDPSTVPNADSILRGLTEAFEALGARTHPVSTNSSQDDGRFTGWLSFPDDEHAHAAFIAFRELLHGVGLVVNQWSRDLVIPRQWR